MVKVKLRGWHSMATLYNLCYLLPAEMLHLSTVLWALLWRYLSLAC